MISWSSTSTETHRSVWNSFYVSVFHWFRCTHTHLCTDKVIQCPRCQRLASSRCLKTGAISVLDSPLLSSAPDHLCWGKIGREEWAACLSTHIHQNSSNGNASVLASSSGPSSVLSLFGSTNMFSPPCNITFIYLKPYGASFFGKKQALVFMSLSSTG